MGTDLCIRGSSRGMEGKCVGRKETRDIGGGNGGGIIHKNEGGVWGV